MADLCSVSVPFHIFYHLTFSVWERRSWNVQLCMKIFKEPQKDTNRIDIDHIEPNQKEHTDKALLELIWESCRTFLMTFKSKLSKSSFSASWLHYILIEFDSCILDILIYAAYKIQIEHRYISQNEILLS